MAQAPLPPPQSWPLVQGADGRSEDRLFTFDFGQFPEMVAGDTLVSNPAPTLSQDSAPTPGETQAATPAVALTLTVVSVTTTAVEVDVTAGTAGYTYSLWCRATTAAGRALICRGLMPVTN